jgi:hypothetical protein
MPRNASRPSVKVSTGRGEQGVIEGTFGKSGKVKVAFSEPISLDPGGGRTPEDNVVTMRFKKYLFQGGPAAAGSGKQAKGKAKMVQ